MNKKTIANAKTPDATRPKVATGQASLITPEIGSAIVTFILGGSLDNRKKWRTQCLRVLPEIIRRVNNHEALVEALKAGMTLQKEGDIWSVDPGKMRIFLDKAKAALANAERPARHEPFPTRPRPNPTP